MYDIEEEEKKINQIFRIFTKKGNYKPLRAIKINTPNTINRYFKEHYMIIHSELWNFITNHFQPDQEIVVFVIENNSATNDINLINSKQLENLNSNCVIPTDFICIYVVVINPSNDFQYQCVFTHITKAQLVSQFLKYIFLIISKTNSWCFPPSKNFYLYVPTSLGKYRSSMNDEQQKLADLGLVEKDILIIHSKEFYYDQEEIEEFQMSNQKYKISQEEEKNRMAEKAKQESNQAQIMEQDNDLRKILLISELVEQINRPKVSIQIQHIEQIYQNVQNLELQFKKEMTNI